MIKIMRLLLPLLLVYVHIVLGLGIAQHIILDDLEVVGMCFGMMVGIFNVTLVYKGKS